MSLIGTLTLNDGGGAIEDGKPVKLSAAITGSANDLSFVWTGPAGTTAPLAGASAILTWTFAAATDSGVYTATLTSATATDSPRMAQVSVAKRISITRFGRQYVSYDPDGAGNGPSTWILSGDAPGAGGSSAVDAQRGVLSAYATKNAETGMAVFIRPDGDLDLADRRQYMNAIVVGVVVSGGAPGQPIAYTADGQVSRLDWSPVAGTALLVPGRRYFLAQDGMISLAAPTERGHFVAPVGRALSTMLLEVEAQLPVRL